jgi:hypothetical protein
MVITDGKIKDLRSIYGELNEDRRKEMEQMAVGLLDVQMIVEKERAILRKKHEGLTFNNEKLV